MLSLSLIYNKFYRRNLKGNTESIAPRKYEVLWKFTIIFVLVHVAAVYGAYLLVTEALWLTCLFVLILHISAMIGISAGVHRLWSHKAYKAKLPLRVILLILYTLAGQNSVIRWSRAHRMHHKYSETDADPHNSLRGFFYSHIGWTMVKPHPEFKAKKSSIDITDLLEDPLLRFQDENYLELLLLIGIIAPTYIATLWGETVWIAIFVAAFFRQILTMHTTFCVNSVAHKWGNKPYDKQMKAAENQMMSLLTVGESFHNYHHTFPWDYRTAELGGYSFNFTKLLIDAMEKIGWAYELNYASKEMIEKRAKRTGDGSHPVWGWNDPDLRLEEKIAVETNYIK